jgi:hypothetical protein
VALADGSGVTPSERYLARLCRRTFLSLWTYSNVYRDQGKHTAAAHGKELCDVLAVCGNDIIIFSDKSIEFGDSGDVRTDWSRWYRRAVKGSADQLHGAERWIKQHPNRLFLDRSCQEPFPLKIGNPVEYRFHLVAVALGANKRCRKATGGSGSLVLCPEIAGAAHVGSSCTPFHIGEIEPKKTFVHVLDDVTLDTVLGQLDTITDLISYLRCKEDFIRSGKLAVAFGEENLLACYLSDTCDTGGHAIILPAGYSQLAINDGEWDTLTARPEFARKHEANRISFVWDHLIEEFCKHTVNGTIIASNANSVAEAEIGFRIMAAESRLNRRALANAWVDRLKTASKSKISIRTVLSASNPETAYVFVTAPERIDDYDEYRAFRRGYLDKYCSIVACKRNLRRVVGIATEPGINNETRSHDFMVFEPSEWTEEAIREIAEIQTKLGVHEDGNLRRTDFHDDEYPAQPAHGRRRPLPCSPVLWPSNVRRNDRCPCGSGVKFKKCCMRAISP